MFLNDFIWLYSIRLDEADALLTGVDEVGVFTAPIVSHLTIIFYIHSRYIIEKLII